MLGQAVKFAVKVGAVKEGNEKYVTEISCRYVKHFKHSSHISAIDIPSQVSFAYLTDQWSSRRVIVKLAASWVGL